MFNWNISFEFNDPIICPIKLTCGPHMAESERKWYETLNQSINQSKKTVIVSAEDMSS